MQILNFSWTINLFGFTKQFCILPTSYWASLIMTTITSHIFINIFRREHFWAVICVKFAMVIRTILSFLVILKSPKVFFLFILPGCSFKCYHLFSHEAQGKNRPCFFNRKLKIWVCQKKPLPFSLIPSPIIIQCV